MKMNINHTEILATRNRTKVQFKTYLHEAEHRVARAKALEILGKESASLFSWAATCIVLGKLGCKFDFLNDDDRLIIKKLRRAISYNT